MELDRSVGHGWKVGQKCGTWLDSWTDVWDMVGQLDRSVGHGWTVGQQGTIKPPFYIVHILVQHGFPLPSVQ